MKKLKVQNPKPDITTVEKAGNLSEWNWYRELSFLCRHAYENNDYLVYKVLKEVQIHNCRYLLPGYF